CDHINLQIADFLTLYYRQQGYILTQVYLPPQEIGKDSTVYLRVQEGILEKVVVDGNRIYTQHQLDGIFSKLIGRPVRSQDIESMLLVLNREPGLNIEGIFKPGTHTGQTILVLKVVQSHRADFTVSADNYGSSITGQDRGTFQFALNNMTHHGDLLSLTVMQKFNPTNSLFYSANYSREVLTPFTRAGVEYDSNKYSLGGSLDGLGLGGESRTIRAYLKHNFFLTREDNLSGDIELQHDVGQLDQNGSGLNQDKLTIFEANLAYGVNYFRWRAAGLLEATYDHGFNRFLDSMGTAPDGGMYPSRQGGDGQYAKGGFDEYAVSYTLLQQPGRFNLLKFYISAQYSNDLLTTFSQMALGGQSCFPAYTTSEFLVDSGIWVHGEWLFPVPGLTDRPFFHMDDKWGDVLHLSI
ncbi:MAG: ShlB/FhaC/HecB family hemolysin secretion/activation protein, partial [Gammaproteobacteria bacterium]|nr:ShlB/FhaC/HecB family hemolysin secretion/activation protein [Gammaproteobacteria bacterium]